MLSSHKKIKRSQSEVSKLFNANYMTFQQRQSTGDREKFSGCQRIKGGGLTRWSTEGHQSIEGTLGSEILGGYNGEYMPLYIFQNP